MTMPAYALPYGLRDVKVRSISSSGTVGTSVDLPASRTFTFTDTADFETLRGDDVDIASHENGAKVNWDLEHGGISLEAYAIFAGGVVTSSGTGATAVKTYSKTSSHSRPYFQVEGQALNDNGGDLHGVIYKAKATGDIEGSFEEGAFRVTSLSGESYADGTGKVYDFVQNASVTAIV